VALVPAAAEAALAQVEDRLELELTNASAMFGNVPLDDAQAGALLRSAFSRNKDLEIVVIADGAVAHMRVAWAFDLARQVGFTKLALAAKKAMPASPIEASDASTNAIIVELPVAGGIKIAGKPVTEAELDAAFAAKLQQDKAAVVIVRAERGVMHARVVAVIDRARRAGLTRIAIAKQ
jgi:biopolymer transport protein ExbD